MLPYENETILELLNDSGLLIASRGLGVHRLFCAFLKLYSADTKCYFVLNTTAIDQRFFTEELRVMERSNLPVKTEAQGAASSANEESTDTFIAPKVITSDVQFVRRVELYKAGGVIFVSSRILLVDLLLNRVTPGMVGGALIWNSHRVVETAHESLICVILARLNTSATFRAFSDAPTRFAFSFGPLRVEKAMRNVHAKRLLLLPRFHTSVATVFDGAQRRNLLLTELHAGATDTFRTLEMTASSVLRSLLAAFREASLRQRLAAYQPDADGEAPSSALDISYDNSVLLSTAAFERLLRCAVEPFWHTLADRARRLLVQLRTVQSFLSKLHTLDPVSFHRTLLAVSSPPSAGSAANVTEQNADWLLLDESARLFELARRRVFGLARSDAAQFDATRCEVSPKWCALLQCLAELRNDDSVRSGEKSTIVLICDSRYTIRQLRALLRFGPVQLLDRIWRQGDAELDAGGADTDDLLVEPSVLSFELSTTDADRMASISDEANLLTAVHEIFSFVFLASSELTFEMRFVRTLQTVQPRYVVLYDADVRAIRQLEVYVAVRDSHASRLAQSDNSIKVYFMQLKDSLEEQRYLNALRQEKTAFENLIREQSSLTVSLSAQTDPFAQPNDFLDADVDPDSGSVWSAERKPRVVVDMREFRSELPCVLFARGFEVVPRTLQIGDYLLTVTGAGDGPVVCVERKSLPDLSQSLASGRLYAQCVQMCRAYERPVVLIEFDLQGGFAPLVRRGESPFGPSETLPNSFCDVQSKLVLLLLRFPALRLVWSPNAYCSSQLFNEMLVEAVGNRLFSNRKLAADNQSNTRTALPSDDANSEDNDPVVSADQYQFKPVDLLLKLPGVTHKNVHSLVRSFASLKAIGNASEDQLFAAFNSREDARRLHAFFHKSVAEDTDTNADQQPTTSNRRDAPKRPRGPALHLAALVKDKRLKSTEEPQKTT